MAGEKGNGWFRIALEVIVAAAAVVSTWVAVDQRAENQNLEEKVATLEQKVNSLLQDLSKANSTVEEQRKRLRRSLDTFTQDYKLKVSDAGRALAAYEDFDTPGNRNDYKERFDTERAKRLDVAKQKMRALVVFVKEWRLVLVAFREMVNGELDGLDIAITKDDEKTMVIRFAVIRDNADTKIRLLGTALDGAVK